MIGDGCVDDGDDEDDNDDDCYNMMELLEAASLC